MIEVQMASPAEGAQLAYELAGLVNRVYAVAEDGLWADGASRTTPDEMAELISAGEIAVARADERVAGAVRLQTVRSGVAEFGMLVSDPELRGVGIGRELVRFAEERARRQGQDIMQLELLTPLAWSHPSKEFLRAWYTRAGYRPVESGSFEDAYPELAPRLATPCDFVIFHKNLHRHR